MPLIHKQEGPLNTQMGIWKITELEDDLIKKLTFTDIMIKQLCQIKHETKRLEWLASRLLLQQLLNLPPSISYSANGKPYIKNLDIHLSISHTNGYAAVITSAQKPTGIDIEYPSTRIGRLVSRFCNTIEQQQFDKIGKEKGSAIVWCAKETIYKIVDIPGLKFKEDIIIEKLSKNDSGTLQAKIKISDKWKSLTLHYRITAEFYLVWYW